MDLNSRIFALLSITRWLLLSVMRAAMNRRPSLTLVLLILYLHIELPLLLKQLLCWRDLVSHHESMGFFSSISRFTGIFFRHWAKVLSRSTLRHLLHNWDLNYFNVIWFFCFVSRWCKLGQMEALPSRAFFTHDPVLRRVEVVWFWIVSVLSPPEDIVSLSSFVSLVSAV